MTARRPRALRVIRDSTGLATALVRYWTAIFPIARCELRRWRLRAARIADPVVGPIARGALAKEGLNAEGAALFALLAPAPWRATTVRLLVRFQILYDYLDALTEVPFDGMLEASHQLHLALATALGAPAPQQDYYAGYPAAGDGGYLEQLTACVRSIFLDLPAALVVMPLALEAVRRSAEGQSHSHAASVIGQAPLMLWARASSSLGGGLSWWETAAASESSLVVHALLGAATDATLTTETADRIAGAYWPWIGGLNALLDDLVDLKEDAREGTHSYVRHYGTWDKLAERLGLFAERASEALRCLPAARMHATIFAGMASFYLSALESDAREARLAGYSVQRQLDMDVSILLVVLRLRRAMCRGGGG